MREHHKGLWLHPNFKRVWLGKTISDIGNGIIVLSILFIGQFAGDIFVEIYLINEISLRQSLIPSHLLGRANASMQFLTGGVGPIGALLAGVLGIFIGIRITILIGVLGVILAGLCLLLSPVRKTLISQQISTINGQ